MDVLEAACGIRRIGMSVSHSQRATCQREEFLFMPPGYRTHGHLQFHSCYRSILTRSLHNCTFLPLGLCHIFLVNSRINSAPYHHPYMFEGSIKIKHRIAICLYHTISFKSKLVAGAEVTSTNVNEIHIYSPHSDGVPR